MKDQDTVPKDARGAIPELAGVLGADLLDEIKQRVQYVWIKAFGLDLIKRELPLAWAKWETDEQRAKFGALPLFLYSWFTNKYKEAPKVATKTLSLTKKSRWRDTGESCKQAFYEDTPMGCLVHASNEVCEIDGRK